MTDQKTDNTSNKEYTEDVGVVLKAERKHLDKEKGDLYGLAVSGGGIRSASFGLGVMQALSMAGVLRMMDYMSTVSGGGYLGSSLTWWLSQRKSKEEGETEKEDEPVYSLEENDLFPFGQKDKGGRDTEDDKSNSILDFIRQHGNYLVPGEGISAISLGAVVLRAMFVSIFVYFALLTLVMLVVILLVKGVVGVSGLWQTEWVAWLPLEISEWSAAFAYWFFFIAAILVFLFVGGSLFNAKINKRLRLLMVPVARRQPLTHRDPSQF